MKYEHLITEGVEQKLGSVAFHRDGPLKRYLMMQRDAVTGDGGFRVAVHVLKGVSGDVQPYSGLHWHDFDEVNLILPDKAELVYKIQLEDETYTVKAPATVYIPAGTRHAAEVISGTGVFLAITFTKNYVAKQ